jgi:Tfp pilus assembly protein PilF
VRFDVIVCPTAGESPSIPYALDFEWIQLVRSSLESGGIACQPVSMANLSETSVRSIIRGFAYNFPFVTVWWTGSDHFLLLGSMTSLNIEVESLAARISSDRVGAELDGLGIYDYRGILPLFLMGREAALAFAGQAPLNSRTAAPIAYSEPRIPAGRDQMKLLIGMEAARELPLEVLPDMDRGSHEYHILKENLEACTNARDGYLSALMLTQRGKLKEAANRFEDAMAACPYNGVLARRLSDFYIVASRTLAAEGRVEDAIKVARRAVEITPEEARTYHNLAAIEASRDAATSMALLQKAVQLDRHLIPAHLLLAELQVAAGEVEAAGYTVADVLSVEPFNPRARYVRALSLIERNMMAEAHSDLLAVLEAEPDNIEAMAALAYVWLLGGELDRSQELYERVLERSPDNLSALNNYATVLAEKGLYEEAVDAWQEALAIDPGNPGIKANIMEARQKMRRP